MGQFRLPASVKGTSTFGSDSSFCISYMELMLANACRTCNMESRAPEYAGVCMNSTFTYDAQQLNSSTPYICMNITDGVLTADVACTLPVDRQLDCDALCVCQVPVTNTTTLSSGCASRDSSAPQYCHCEACESVVPADQDSSYSVIADLAGDALSRRRMFLEQRQRKLLDDQHIRRSRGLQQVYFPCHACVHACTDVCRLNVGGCRHRAQVGENSSTFTADFG